MSSSNTDDNKNSILATLAGARTGSVTDVPDHRRSSTSSKGMFGGLQDQKRSPADIAAQKARRDSFADHNSAPGFLGGLWNSIVKGHGK